MLPRLTVCANDAVYNGADFYTTFMEQTAEGGGGLFGMTTGVVAVGVNRMWAHCAAAPVHGASVTCSAGNHHSDFWDSAFVWEPLCEICGSAR